MADTKSDVFFYPVEVTLTLNSYMYFGIDTMEKKKNKIKGSGGRGKFV